MITTMPSSPASSRDGHIGPVRLVTGWLLIGLGILGLFLPFLQGIALIVAGAALLGRDSPPGKLVRNWRAAYLKRRRRGGRPSPGQ